MKEFRKELESLINRHSMENLSNTPDYLIARYLLKTFRGLNDCVQARDKFYNMKPLAQHPMDAQQLEAVVSAAKFVYNEWRTDNNLVFGMNQLRKALEGLNNVRGDNGRN